MSIYLDSPRPLKLNYAMETPGKHSPANLTKIDSMSESGVSLERFETYAQNLIRLCVQYHDMNTE